MINSDIQIISPTMAKHWLETTNIHNRKISKALVSKIATDILQGRWVVNGQAISFNISSHLVDGQHRLRAIVKADKDVQALVVTGLPLDAFSTVDSGKARTNGDVFNLEGIPNAINVVTVIRAVLIECYGSSCRTLSSSRLLNTYSENAEVFQEAVLFAMRMRAHSPLMHIGTLGSAYVLYKSNNSPFLLTYIRFIEKVVEGVNLTPKSPEIAFLKWALLNSKYSRISGHVENVKRRNALVQSLNILSRRREISKLTVVNSETPQGYFPYLDMETVKKYLGLQ